MNKPEYRISLTCLYCGIVFQRDKSVHAQKIREGQTATYCTRSCACRARAQQLPPSVIDDYLQGYTLEQVGQRHDVSLGKVRRYLLNHNIPIRPSYAHIIAGRNPLTGKKHSEEAKQKCRDAQKKQFSSPEARQKQAHEQCQRIANGEYPTVSKIEDRVADELTRRGLIFKRQEGLRHPTTGRFFACVDFQLSDGTVIEVNGTYWHADPRVYPNGPIHATQRKVAKNYATKMQIMREMNIKVVEIWELDLESNFIGAIDSALGL